MRLGGLIIMRGSKIVVRGLVKGKGLGKWGWGVWCHGRVSEYEVGGLVKGRGLGK